MFSDQDRQFFRKNRGKILLAALFVVLGILVIALGVLHTVLIILLGIAGWVAGRVLDDKEMIKRFLNNYLGK